jgi:hypothetical protein
MTQAKAAAQAANPPNLYQRLLAIMGELDHVEKAGKTNWGEKFEYVKHDDVMRAVQPLLVKHGVFMATTTLDHGLDEFPPTKSGTARWRTTLCVQLVFINADDPAETLSTTVWAYGVDESDKGPGKAISYAMKTAIQKMLCLPAGTEADNESVDTSGSAQARPRARSRAKASSSSEEPAPDTRRATVNPAVARFWNVARDQATPGHPGKVSDDTVRMWFKRNLGLESTKEASDEQLAEATKWAAKFMPNMKRLADVADIIGLTLDDLAKQVREMFDGVTSFAHLSLAEWEELLGWADRKAQVTLDEAAQATEGGTNEQPGDDVPF